MGLKVAPRNRHNKDTVHTREGFCAVEKAVKGLKIALRAQFNINTVRTRLRIVFFVRTCKNIDVDQRKIFFPFLPTHTKVSVQITY